MADPAVRFALAPDLDPAIVREVGRHWWPLSRLGEGLEELVRRSGLRRSAPAEPLIAPETVFGGRSEDLDAWLVWAASRMGAEAEAVDAPATDVAQMLAAAGPAIAFLTEPRGQGFILILRSSGGRVRLLGPDMKVRTCAVQVLRTSLYWRLEAPLRPEIDALLVAAKAPARRREAVRAAMLRERLADQRVAGVWLLRLPATADFTAQLAGAGVIRSIGVVLAVFALIYGLEIGGWSLIGSGVLSGRLDFGWMAAWLLLIVTMTPWRFVGGWFESRFAVDAGRILKSRLLAGALRMEQEGVTRQGVGQLLGGVMEAQALEALALNGGMTVLVSLLELVFAGWILSAGAGGAMQVVLLVAWLAFTAWMGWRFYRRLSAWSQQRLDMTNDLIEGMVGHRTRLAQERPGRRDGAEDTALQRYVGASRSMDNAGAFVLAGMPSGWLLLGVIGLVPIFVSGAAPSPAGMAISLGGLMLAQRALAGLSGGLAGAARAAVAWRQVSPLFRAGRGEAEARPFMTPAQMRASGVGSPLLEANGVEFRYDPEGRPAIRDAGVCIRLGDRILLEGPSGGGKSTLASLLTGLRTPTAGLMLLNGLDRHTLGDSWRSMATSAPQFHENHVLSGPLAFNLLMGREWPPKPADLKEAEGLCEELGLGTLLARMPAGIMQRVGETGWQLSHGERSRIFLARALLQRTQLTIMDESFAALDPATLERCLRVAIRRTQSLIVIAHP